MHGPTMHSPRKGMKVRPSAPSKKGGVGLTLLRKNLAIPQMIQGFARGYNERADLITQTLDGANLNTMWDEFQRSISIANRDRNALVELLTYRVANPVERVMIPSGEDFEESTEYGQPKGMRLPTHFPVGFDFRNYDLGLRFTFDFLAESTRVQLEALNNQAIEASNRLQFTRALRAIFRNTNRSFVQDLALTDAVTVYPFYNNDGTTPPPYKTYTHDNTHTHYLVSGGATIDSGDLDDMETHLYHHGYGIQQGSRLVLLVNRQEGLTVRKFRVASGDRYDFIPSPNVGGGVFVAAGTFIGRPQGTIPGEIGTYGPWIVVEEDLLPAGYVIGFSTGGENNLSNPVGVREHENTALRGLKLVKGRDNDYPLIDSFYRHGLGTGVRHRGAGVVLQVKASGTYDIPTGY